MEAEIDPAGESIEDPRSQIRVSLFVPKITHDDIFNISLKEELKMTDIIRRALRFYVAQYKETGRF